MRVAVVGSGVAGLAAAWTLANAGASVVLYEKDEHIGGHAHTFHIPSKDLDVDLGFMVFNSVTYPNMLEFFDALGVPIEPSDMSFSVSVPQCEWGSNGVAGLLAHKRNALRPAFWRMVREMVVFRTDVLKFLKRVEGGGGSQGPLTLGEFLAAHGYSTLFKDCYLIPVCASIWSCGTEGVLGFDAYAVLSFLRNHHMLQLVGRPQWLTVKGRSQVYVNKTVEWVQQRGGAFKTNTQVTSVTNADDGRVIVEDAQGGRETFDSCVLAVHAPDALPLLGPQATGAEAAILSAFEYSSSDIFLHSDASFMPRRKAAWSAWNFRGTVRGRVCVTYWLNTLQNLGDTGDPILVTLNPERSPSKVHARWTTSHPIPSPAAATATSSLGSIQGQRNLFFCGAWQGYGFHEDGFKAGVRAASALLGRPADILPNPLQMELSLWQAVARLAVLLFFQSFIRLGSLQILEAGGTVHDFGRNSAGANSFLPFIPFVTAWLQKRRAAQQARPQLTNTSTNVTISTPNTSNSTSTSTSRAASATNGDSAGAALANGPHNPKPPASGTPLTNGTSPAHNMPNGTSAASPATSGVPATNGVNHATSNGTGLANGHGKGQENGEGHTQGYTPGAQEGGALFLPLSKEDSGAPPVPTKSAVVAALAPNGLLEPEPHLTVHSPAFYWKVATRADLGLADAFIEGDFSCSNGCAGLLSLLELLVVNRDSTKHPGRRPLKTRGWWSPALLTAVIGSAELYLRHMLRSNSVANARRNISNHYDLSNEMFSKFLDTTMTYSCAIFQNPMEPLEAAQQRKLGRLIDKAQIEAHHRVLEIGFGWGSLALEVIRRTGCHVTGITLSRQQLQLASERVKAAGLEDHVTFILCDYRQLPGNGAFDRILSCEMLEAVGHEYLGEFFFHCDRLLKMDGLLVVQVITTPEERYEEYRHSSDFIKEYIFPGCCVPSLSALTGAMAESSAFSVEHVENIGPHYATTLLRWLDNFEEKKEEIMAMGFGPKFIRMWQYYFVYCAVGFKTRTLGDLQIVFSRPGNARTLGDLVVGTQCENIQGFQAF